MAIYTKLLSFQKANITIEKDGINPHFKNEYSTLNEVLDKVRKPLNDVGILILQQPEIEGLRTTLYDTGDDTSITGIMPWVGHDNPQKVLSCSTYYRRGSLVAILGLQDTDDDGNSASAPTYKKEKVNDKDDLF